MPIRLQPRQEYRPRGHAVPGRPLLASVLLHMALPAGAMLLLPMMADRPSLSEPVTFGVVFETAPSGVEEQQATTPEPGTDQAIAPAPTPTVDTAMAEPEPPPAPEPPAATEIAAPAPPQPIPPIPTQAEVSPPEPTPERVAPTPPEPLPPVPTQAEVSPPEPTTLALTPPPQPTVADPEVTPAEPMASEFTTAEAAEPPVEPALPPPPPPPPTAPPIAAAPPPPAPPPPVKAAARPAPRPKAERPALQAGEQHTGSSAIHQVAANPMPAPMRSADQGPLHITAPRFRVPPSPPVYPRSARQQGQEGEVLIRANLDPEGNPEEVRLLRSSGIEALDRAAIAAVRRWVFEPGRRNGVAVVAWVQVPIRFTLR